KNTELKVTYKFDMVDIAKKRSKLKSLGNIVDAYSDHQREVVTKRSKNELKKAREREHIEAGLNKAQ
ncbi:hypothetical protein FO516_29740, partial [Priestia megaterium]